MDNKARLPDGRVADVYYHPVFRKDRPDLDHLVKSCRKDKKGADPTVATTRPRTPDDGDARAKRMRFDADAVYPGDAGCDSDTATYDDMSASAGSRSPVDPVRLGVPGTHTFGQSTGVLRLPVPLALADDCGAGVAACGAGNKAHLPVLPVAVKDVAATHPQFLVAGAVTVHGVLDDGVDVTAGGLLPLDTNADWLDELVDVLAD